MKKLLLFPGVAGLLLMTACTPTTSVPVDTSNMSSSSSMMRTSSSASSAATTSSASSTSSVSDTSQTRVIEVTADNWNFSPSSISAKKGEKLVVRVTGSAGLHSFGVPDLGINVTVNPGETKDIEISTDTAGTFDFRCMIPCGAGHKDMVGTIVIS